MLKFTRDPPVYQYNRYVKETYLDSFVPKPVEVDGKTLYEIEIPAAREGLRWLMHVLQMPYDPHVYVEPREFSEDEKRILFPFALMMCCLDGNVFGDDFIEQYIPDVWAVIKSNFSTFPDEDVFGILAAYIDRALPEETPG